MATYLKRKTKDGEHRVVAMVRVRPHPAECQTFGNKRDAKRWAEPREQELRKTPAGLDIKHTLGELIAYYKQVVLPTLPRRKSAHKKAGYLAWWEKRIGADTPLTEITGQLLLTIKGEMLKSGKSGPTFNRYLSNLSAVMKVAIRTLQWLRENPCAWVERAPDGFKRTRYLDPDTDQVHRLLVACREQSQELYEMALVSLWTGGRRSKVEGLSWDDIDLSWETVGKDDDEGAVLFRDTKNTDDVRVAIFAEPLDLLRQRYRQRRMDSRYVWPHPKDGTRTLWTRNQWDKARKAAGLPFGKAVGRDTFCWHTFRHAAGARLAMGGASTHQIKEHLGQRTAAAAEHYIHFAASHRSTVGRRMSDRLTEELREHERRAQG